jgi:hypothetical protein
MGEEMSNSHSQSSSEGSESSRQVSFNETVAFRGEVAQGNATSPIQEMTAEFIDAGSSGSIDDDSLKLEATIESTGNRRSTLGSRETVAEHAVGLRVGNYEILSLLGRGGMELFTKPGICHLIVA